MAQQLPPSEFLAFLQCPHCRGDLVPISLGAKCNSCHRRFPSNERNILEMVDESQLDPETARELRGNTAVLTDEHIEHMARKRTWSEFFNHFAQGKLEMITRFLESASGVTPICFLGAGSGYEARELAAKVQLGTILCSDLAYTMLAVVPRTLDDVKLRYGLFTSDLQNVPLRRSDSAVIIHEALHHTADMHETLRKLLAVGHARLILVEPVGNTLLRILAKFGLAQRVEYSGVRPGKLDLRRALRLASEHGYRTTVWTGWEFPGDYYERFFTWVPMCVFLKAVDFLSRIGRPFQFGNFAVIYLWKT